jgi:HKD family nuclease
MALPDGLYDQLLTRSLDELIARGTDENARSLQALNADDAPARLAEVLVAQLAKILDDLEGEGATSCASSWSWSISSSSASASAWGRARRAPTRCRARADPAGHSPPVRPPVPPETGLAAPWLFTAGKGSPALLTELRRELAACDRVDILVSFITHSGVRKLLDVLQAITAVGADGEPRTRIRILTTTYTGATEARALDALAGLPGCEIRVSLDGRRTRLHAKAWLFRRRTGFGSAYVGSANLSGAALMGGLEWTTKLPSAASPSSSSGPAPTSKPCGKTASFSATTRPTGPPQRPPRGAAARVGRRHPGPPDVFRARPKAYQQEMLDQLQLERDHGRWRNLVVAATGTGKTVVAAFDYRRLCIQQGGQPRLLFVAHREEILRQALRTYREVLRDHAFGELLAGGMEPESFDHLFATIDSVASRDLLARRGAGHWYAVVVDECHRLAADRFDAFVTQVSPRILLGLTATPERSDGKPILGYFDNRPDGAPAVELRLWHALDQQLLCPFEYYACDDDTDFSSVPWAQAGEWPPSTSWSPATTSAPAWC